jgi:hypothetical protein
MSSVEDKANHHAAELARLTRKAADQGAEPLPEDELANLGSLIAVERQMLIDAVGEALRNADPDAFGHPGVAEFDAGFLYGLAFARLLEDTRVEMDRLRRGRLLRLAKGNGVRS